MSTADLLFVDATILDGTGAEPRAGHVAVRGDRVTVVGDGDAPAGLDAAERVDAGGLVLAPGFVDVHTHDDWAVLADPDHGCKTLQGVTSVVIGNCGSSAFPGEAQLPGMPVFEGLAAYAAELEASPAAVNVGSLVGHGTVRSSVIGLREARAATDDERAAMGTLVAAALDDGALGLSSGIAYEPGTYADVEELVALATLVHEAGGIYTTHMRDEAEGLLRSVDESIEVAERSGCPLQISHLKAAGRASWGMVGEALRRIDAARARGVDVMADQYPYTRGSTLLEQVVRSGALDGPSSFGHLRPDDVLIAAAPGHPEWVGRTIDAIAVEEGCRGREMADRIVEATGRSCFVVIDIMSEDDVRTVMAHPLVMVGSDGVPVGESPHPRLHHTYPRVLGHYSRDTGLLSLPDAVRRMTAMPAERFGLVDRGVVRVDAFADLVLFDPDTVIDTGTYEAPTSVPVGVAGVWVNGERVAADGAVTGARPGRVVRR